MTAKTLRITGVAALALGFTACGPESAPDGPTNLMSLEEASNGFGQLVPHTIRKLDATGNPTAQIVNIRSQAVSYTHLTLPTTPYV